MSLDSSVISKKIEKSIIEEGEFSDEEAHDIAFHMTDWLHDLERYYAFCQEPERFSSEQVDKLLIDFLVHVPNHLAAASKLFCDIPVTDIFHVGATSEDDNGG